LREYPDAVWEGMFARKALRNLLEEQEIDGTQESHLVNGVESEEEAVVVDEVEEVNLAENEAEEEVIREVNDEPVAEMDQSDKEMNQERTAGRTDELEQLKRDVSAGRRKGAEKEYTKLWRRVVKWLSRPWAKIGSRYGYYR
jgi:hypothetical protein